jgi:hypothetical protein
MGTRGLVGFAYKGELKVTYNHSDSYPSELGQRVVDFCNSMQEVNRETKEGDAWDVLKDNVEALKLVDAEGKPNDNEIDYYRATEIIDSSSKDTKTWYSLLRNTQGGEGLDFVFQGEQRHWIDSREFANESLFCEYAYVLDLDHMTLDVFKGFQHEPQEGNPFGQKPSQDEYSNGEKGDVWYPVRCLASFPIRNIPKDWRDVFTNYEEVKQAEKEEKDSKVIRIENTTANHNKFWQITDLGDGQHLAEWGPIGKTKRSTIYPSSIAFKKMEQKIREGYVEVA